MANILWMFLFAMFGTNVVLGAEMDISGQIEDIIRSSFIDVSRALFAGPERVNKKSMMDHMAHGINKPNAKTLRLNCIWEAKRKARSNILKNIDLHGAEGSVSSILLANEPLFNSLSRTHCGFDIQQRSAECDASYEYRTIDGTCNNVANEGWGSAPRAYERYLPAEYGDDNEPRGEVNGTDNLPSARTVSQVMANAEPLATPQISVLFSQWGQFLIHDIAHTPERVDGATGGTIECCTDGIINRQLINNPPYDGYNDDCRLININFSESGDECVRFVRSLNDDSDDGDMEQINQQSAFVDASQVYGYDDDVADYLRTKSGGLLNTTDNEATGQPMPPYGGDDEVQACPLDTESECFLSGDVRIDIVPGLVSMHTVFIRLHNIIANELAALNSHWDDETIYQETRRIIGAFNQQITYRDWLPILLGSTVMSDFNLNVGSDGYSDTYDSDVDPTIRNVFAAAAFRFGHSMVGENAAAADEAHDIPLAGNFFNISYLQKEETSPSSMLKGMARCPMEAVDTVVGDTLRDELWLATINVMRGREHGIPGYGQWRNLAGLTTITNLFNLKTVMASDIAIGLNRIYGGEIEEVDLFAAGLGETPEDDGLVGPTFAYIIGHQFAQLKHGDRFWYERDGQPKPFTTDQLDAIRDTTLRSILCRVTEDSGYSFQENPFLTTDVADNAAEDCIDYNFLDLSYWEEAN